MSRTDGNRTLPKSMRHKRILEVAAENPEASVEDIAADVPSATPELVEHVFSEYGDPADESTAESDTDNSEPVTDSSTDGEPLSTADSETDSPADSDESSSTDDPDTVTDSPTDSDDLPSADDLTDAQREALRAIAQDPDATQRELAESLNVTAATVSKRVNDIPGFDWSDREAFVTALDIEPMSHQSDPDLQREIADLSERLHALEERVEATTDSPSGVLDDPELVHKVVHACMDSDTISEDEELRIIQSLLD